MRIYSKRTSENKVKLFIHRLLKGILAFLVIIFILNTAVSYASKIDLTKKVSIDLNADVVSRADTVSDDKIDVVGVRESHVVEPLNQISEIVDKIFILESSGGKYVNCPDGKFNGFGFAQNKYVWNCYDTQEEVRELVKGWFEEKLKNHKLENSLCIYNTGIDTNECDYIDKFNSL